MKMLGDFSFLSKRVASENSHKESRGKKGERARKAIVNELSDQFIKYCAIETWKDEDKIGFIKLALDFANIPYPQNIKRLFYRHGEKRVVLKQFQ